MVGEWDGVSPVTDQPAPPWMEGHTMSTPNPTPEPTGPTPTGPTPTDPDDDAVPNPETGVGLGAGEGDTFEPEETGAPADED
jgi:hypothetical protein